MTVIKLVGIYTDPNWVIRYKEPATFQLVAMCFEAKLIGGEMGTSNETTEVGWFTPVEIETMDMVGHHPQRIADALANREAAFVR